MRAIVFKAKAEKKTREKNCSLPQTSGAGSLLGTRPSSDRDATRHAPLVELVPDDESVPKAAAVELHVGANRQRSGDGDDGVFTGESRRRSCLASTCRARESAVHGLETN